MAFIPIIFTVVIVASSLFLKLKDSHLPKKSSTNMYMSGKVKTVFFCIVAVSLCILFFHTYKEPDIALNEDSIHVSGLYGDKYDLEDIHHISLKSTIPKILSKEKGSVLGEIKKGYFNLEGLGLNKLFLHSTKGPYVFIKTKNDNLIINLKNREKTEALFEELIYHLDNSKN